MGKAIAAAAMFLVLLVLPSCGSGGSEPASSADPEDFDAALETARRFRALGLPGVALSELDYVRANASADSSVRARALFLAGDCHLDRGALEKAIGAYRDAASTAVEHQALAVRKIAEAYLNRGRWEDALGVVREAEPAGFAAADARAVSDLARRVEPMSRLETRYAFDPSRGVRHDGTGSWAVPDPMRFELLEGEGEHARLRFRAQKGMLGMHLPLPWAGESFRMTLRFRVDGVDSREHRITTHMGIARQSFFGDAGDEKPIPGNDSLLVQVAAVTLQDGELRDRHVNLVRTRDMEEGGETRSQAASLLASAPLDVWIRVVVEYSRELSSFRARAYRSFHNREDAVVADAVVTNAIPFGEGPFFLSLGAGIEGGDKFHVMEISVDTIRFETVPGTREPDVSRFRLDRPSFVGNLRFVFRDNGGAVRAWEEAWKEGALNASLRVLMATAFRREGRVRRAEEHEAALVAGARDLRPGEVDELDLYGRFDPDMERLSAKIREERGEH